MRIVGSIIAGSYYHGVGGQCYLYSSLHFKGKPTNANNKPEDMEINIAFWAGDGLKRERNMGSLRRGRRFNLCMMIYMDGYKRHIKTDLAQNLKRIISIPVWCDLFRKLSLWNKNNKKQMK